MQNTFKDFNKYFSECTNNSIDKEESKVVSDDELNLVWNSMQTIFVFDTNVLSRLYKYDDDENIRTYLNIFKGLKSQIWLPHQVGLEFYKNLQSYQEERFANKAKLKRTFATERINNLKKGTSVPIITNNKKNKLFIDEIINTYEKLDKEINEAYSTYIKDDFLLKEIETIFNNKIGTPFSKKDLKQIYKEGEYRYKCKIPPGFKDEPKKKNKLYSFRGIVYNAKFGDLIIWKQIIKKSQNKNIRNVIFITNDTKEDWWEDEQHTIPKYYLIDEIQSQANIEFFHMYTMDSFLKEVQKFKPDIAKNVPDKVIKSIIWENAYEDLIDENHHNFSQEVKNKLILKNKKEFLEDTMKIEQDRQEKKFNINLLKRKQFFQKNNDVDLYCISNQIDGNNEWKEDEKEVYEWEEYEKELAYVSEKHSLASREQAAIMLELEREEEEEFFR